MRGLLAGAWLWERDLEVRRFAARALLGVWLLAAGVFARESGDPWPLLAAPAALLGIAMILVALGSRRPAQTEAVPGWPSTLRKT